MEEIPMEAKGHIDIAVSGRASASLWHWYSIYHAVAAAHFARQAHDIEEQPPPPSPDERSRGMRSSEAGIREYRSCVTASVVLALAFLEATINEVFESATHPELLLGKMTEAERGALVEAKDMLRNNRLLDRFQLSLPLMGRAPFDRGQQPYQDAALVVQLRNALVHYRPRMRSSSDQGETKLRALESRYREQQVSLNPFTSDGNPFFPDKCMSYGGARWACRATQVFADEYFSRLGVTPVYGSYAGELRLP